MSSVPETTKIQSTIPCPSFILQNSNQITCVLFSKHNKDILYSSNRNGDVTLYDLNLRRAILSKNPNKQSILSIAESDQNSIFTHSRNGSLYKWTKAEANWNINCQTIFLFIFK